MALKVEFLKATAILRAFGIVPGVVIEDRLIDPVDNARVRIRDAADAKMERAWVVQSIPMGRVTTRFFVQDRVPTHCPLDARAD